MEKLSETLKCDHECGDFGKALEGYTEKAKELEDLLEWAIQFAPMADERTERADKLLNLI